MKARIVLTLVILSAMWAPSSAAPEKERCGTRQPSLEEVEQIEARISRVKGKVRRTQTIPVWVHVISKGAGFANGDVPEAMIRAQIRVLNDSFNGRTGGANTGFAFDLAGITRTNNAAWFDRATQLRRRARGQDARSSAADRER